MLLWRITRAGGAWDLREGVVVQAERWFDAREWGRAYLGIDEFDGDGAIEHPCPDAILRWVGTDAGARPVRRLEAELAPWLTPGERGLSDFLREIVHCLRRRDGFQLPRAPRARRTYLAGLDTLVQRRLAVHARLGVHRAWRLTEWGKSYARGDH